MSRYDATPYYKGFTVISDWMFSLGLTLTETMCYAIIYGMSRNSSGYLGSPKSLGLKINIAEETITDALNTLEKRGLIEADSLSYPTNLTLYTAPMIKKKSINDLEEGDPF